MKIENWYSENFESDLRGRYITLEMIIPLLKSYDKKFEITFPGVSENGIRIPMVKIGDGKRVVLAWSQMHGNESTTTKALFDLFKFLDQEEFFQEEVVKFLETYSLYVIPILNPDGAKIYTRENANGVDLNRDAQDLSQNESRLLRMVFDKIEPELCLNMHDQRSIFGLDSGLAATISFLSPSADSSRVLTDSRKKAMVGIVKMNNYLQTLIPGQVGRFDDSFNSNCVGDTFQMAGVPTILFEAGHYKNDYQREKPREFIFYSLLVLFGIVGDQIEIDYEDYFQIPENRKNYKDIIIRNVKLDQRPNLVDVAIQYTEILKDEKIVLEPIVNEIGGLEGFYGHSEEDMNGSDLLTNTAKDLTVGVKVFDIHDFSKELSISFHRNVF